jgi:hypothetical protein
VGKSTVKPRISRHIYVGTAANDRLFVIGCFAGKVSRGLMNYNDISVLTQEKSGSPAPNVESDSCEVIICGSIRKRIRINPKPKNPNFKPHKM